MINSINAALGLRMEEKPILMPLDLLKISLMISERVEEI